MANIACPNCGYPLKQGQTPCPECGTQLEWSDNSGDKYNTSCNNQNSSSASGFYNNNQPVSTWKTDKAQYIYECWVIGWKSFGQMFRFSGRASRREFWSYYFLVGIINIIPIIGFILWIIGLCSVGVRRMHDSDHSGWWILVPFQCFFLYLKKSDEDENYYGNPEPATDFLED